MSSNDTSDNVNLRFTGAFNVTGLKEGEHTFLMPFSDSIAQLVGQIVAYWGAFEFRMDKMTECVVEGMRIDAPDNWKRQTFKKRKELFRDVMRVYTSHHFPSLSIEFDTVASIAGGLHWKRNVIAHGFYESVPCERKDEPNNYDVTLIAKGMVKNREKTIPLDEETLREIWHDISHLTGRLLFLVGQMGGKIDALDVVVPDIDYLRDEKSGNFRILPISSRF